MADNDSMVLEDAAAAVARIDVRYRAADINDKIALKPERDRAFEAYSRARLKLLEEGVLTSNADVTDMKELRSEIEEAAATQQLIVAAGRLVGFLVRFA